MERKINEIISFFTNTNTNTEKPEEKLSLSKTNSSKTLNKNESSNKITSVLINSPPDFCFLEDIPTFKNIIQKAKKLDVERQIKVHSLLTYISQGGFNSIDSKNIFHIMFSGIPDEIPGLRTLIWKLSLNYPSESKVIHSPKWQEEIDKLREEYLKIKEVQYKNIQFLHLKSSSLKNSDPLSSHNEEWKEYFNDHELLDEIEKDVRRTRAQMSFFLMPVNKNLDISNYDISLKADLIREPTKKGNEAKFKFECHCDVLTRILFIYAKNNPNVKYIQGMNEVLAPIYFQICLENNEDNSLFKENEEMMKNEENLKTTSEFDKIEADAYYCFVSLMSEIMDLFIREKDEHRNGIQMRIENISNMLKVIDVRVYSHFQELGIEIQFFMFKWYALLFTQEYEMPDVLRLWDSILSFHKSFSIDKFEFLSYLCLSIIINRKEKFIGKDFSTTMLSFQSFEDIDVTNHIISSWKLLKAHSDNKI